MVKLQEPPARNSNEWVVFEKPFGPHQRSRCRASVKARNTAGLPAAINRDTVISLSRAVWSSGIRVLLVFQLLGVPLQALETLLPELSKPTCPLVNRSQCGGIEAVDPLLAAGSGVDQPDLLQHPEVLGDRGLSDSQDVGDVVGRHLAGLQQREDATPLRLGDGSEGVGGRSSRRHLSNHIPI